MNVRREIIEWALTFIVPIVLVTLLHSFVFTFSIVRQTSMLETLHEDEWLAVSRLHYRLTEPATGDIVMAYFPGQGDMLFVKRLIGKPGDEIESRGGQIFLNGERIDEPYIVYPSFDDFGPKFLGENEYFLMGDNREGSLDSRNLGTIPKEDLYGFVMGRVFPFGEMRWFYR
ncbi:MAG: signal peptidase I [Christensenellaceae bacterium]|nr:signal peptidase I [Christensenellaceae bacterium]